MRIVIVGSTSGIGKMITERLTAQGHWIFEFSRTTQVTCDVTNYEEVSECARTVLDIWDGADALIICAGTQGELGSTYKTDSEKWKETINVNLIGTYNCIKAFYQIMNPPKRGKIICFAGGGAAYGRPFFSAYAAAKAATVRLIETFAMEVNDVDINAIAPGAIKTNIINDALKAGPDKIGQIEYDKAVKQNEQGDDPEPALKLVDWLLSEESDGVTGRLLSAKWDNYKDILDSKDKPDMFKLRRVTEDK